MYKIGIKYLYDSRAVCAHPHDFRKRPVCAYWSMCANKSDYGTRKFLLGVGGGTAQELREKENGLSRYGISCL